MSFLREMCQFIGESRFYAGPRRRFYWIHIIRAAPGAVRQLRAHRRAVS